MIQLAKNFTVLRVKSGLKQSQLGLLLGFSKGAWNNYELGVSKPNLDDLMKITNYFGCKASDLLDLDLSNVAIELNINTAEKTRNVALIVAPLVALNANNSLNEDQATYTKTPLNTNIMALKDDIIALKNDFIESQKVIIAFLQNQIDQLQIEKERISANSTGTNKRT